MRSWFLILQESMTIPMSCHSAGEGKARESTVLTGNPGIFPQPLSARRLEVTIPAAYTWFAMYHPWFSSKNAASINQRKKCLMSTGIHWGIIGTGSIAHRFARGLAESQTGTLLAVGSRTQEAADTFGETWNVPHRHGSYEALLRDKEGQAVYISTRHPSHVKWAIAAAEAGKHILCEKPIALNYAETLPISHAPSPPHVFLIDTF